MDKMLAELEAQRTKKACQTLYADLGVTNPEKLNLQEVRPEFKGHQKFRLPDQPGYDPKALYFGFQNQSAGNGDRHYYLNVGKHRIDGVPLFYPVKIGSGNVASAGVYFKIPVPEATFRAIEARAEAGAVKRGLTCLHVICKLLEEEGVVIHDAGGARKARARVVSANLLNGKVIVNGKPLAHGEIQVSTTGQKEMEEFLWEAIHADKQMRTTLLGAPFILFWKPLAIAGAATAGGGYVYFYLPTKSGEKHP